MPVHLKGGVKRDAFTALNRKIIKEKAIPTNSR